MIEVRMVSERAPDAPVNEDIGVAVGDLVAVLDGVSQAAGLATGCGHGPAWYVRRLAGHLVRAYVAGPDQPLTDLLAEAIAGVRTEHPGCDLARPVTPAATVCLLRAGPHSLDYLVLCDTTLVLDRGAAPEVVSDDRLARTVAALRRSGAAGDPASDPEQLRMRYALAKAPYVNQPGGYWLAAADPSAAYQAITGEATLTGRSAVRRAVLLTDGARRAVDPLGLTDWPGLLDVLSDEGPAVLVHRIRAAERAAAAGVAGGQKPHDDATVALCRFAPAEACTRRPSTGKDTSP